MDLKKVQKQGRRRNNARRLPHIRRSKIHRSCILSSHALHKKTKHLLISCLVSVFFHIDPYTLEMKLRKELFPSFLFIFGGVSNQLLDRKQTHLLYWSKTLLEMERNMFTLEMNTWKCRFKLQPHTQLTTRGFQTDLMYRWLHLQILTSKKQAVSPLILTLSKLKKGLTKNGKSFRDNFLAKLVSCKSEEAQNKLEWCPLAEHLFSMFNIWRYMVWSYTWLTRRKWTKSKLSCLVSFYAPLLYFSGS